MTTPHPPALGEERALLEAAAKAAGLPYTRENFVAVGEFTHGWGMVARIDTFWNPLADSGQALDLAAHLRLKVIPGKHKGDGCTVESQQPGIAGCTAFRDDPAEQMRFAIVRVAAEIGAAMASERGRG